MKKHEIIKFEDLINDIVSLIKTKCNNIDRYDINPLDQDLFDKKTIIYNREIPDYRKVNIFFKTNNDVLTQVESSTVISQLNAFLDARGINQELKGQLVTTKLLLNFYNNIASFLIARILPYKSIKSKTTYMFYNAKDIKYNEVQLNIEEERIDVTKYEITELFYADLLRDINDTTFLVDNKLTIMPVSSCSSSSSCSCSSSSSCSCSSCSCSSSCCCYFIVYMLLPD